MNQVANPRKPLRLNVGFIINAQIGFSRDFDFDIPLLKASDDLTLTDFKGLAKIGRTPQGLLVQGNFTGNAKQECVRCLSEYEQPLEWELLELYAFDRKSVTESGLIVPEARTSPCSSYCVLCPVSEISPVERGGGISLPRT